VLPAGAGVLSASDADGHRTATATASALREIGWGGLVLAVDMTLRPAGTQVRAGEPLASVTVVGARAVSTTAVAVRALSGPSLGWRLLHVL
jgi:hypothetical protein